MFVRCFSRFGIPDRIVSDNASYFVSAEFAEFMTKNGIKHSTSAPYHPASNGLAKRAVKTCKTGMRKMTQGTLKQKLARFLFSYRTTPHPTTGVSPAELLMNRKLKSALDLLNPWLSDKVVSAQNRQIAAHDKRVPARIFSLGDLVYVRNYGQGPKWIKRTIVDNAGPYNFSVEVTVSDQFTRWKRHADQLRKCYDSSSVTESFGDLTSADVISQEVEEEEEKEDRSELIIYGNLPTLQTTTSIQEPCRNPPRDSRLPDRLTY